MKRGIVLACFALASVYQACLSGAEENQGETQRETWAGWARRTMEQHEPDSDIIRRAQEIGEAMQRRLLERERLLNQQIHAIDEQARNAERRGDTELAKELRKKAFNMWQDAEDANERGRRRVEDLQDQMLRLGVDAWNGAITPDTKAMLPDTEQDMIAVAGAMHAAHDVKQSEHMHADEPEPAASDNMNAERMQQNGIEQGCRGSAGEMGQEVQEKLRRAQEEVLRAIAGSALRQQAQEQIGLQLMKHMFCNSSSAESEGEVAPEGVRLAQEFFSKVLGVMEKYGESLNVIARTFETNLRRYDQERKEHFRQAIHVLNRKADYAENHGNQRESAQLRELVAELEQDDRAAGSRMFETLMRVQTTAAEKGIATYNEMLSVVFSLIKQTAKRDQAIAVAHVQAKQDKLVRIETARLLLAELTSPQNAILLGGAIIGIYALVSMLGNMF